MSEYEDLLHFISSVRTYLICDAVITTILYAFVIYLIIYKTPKQMEKFAKYNLINIATTTYIQLLVVVIWLPITLFNFQAGFSAGPLTLIPFPYMTELMCLLVLILMFNLSLSLMMSFVKQYSLLQPFSAIGTLLGKIGLVFIMYTVSSFLVDALLGLFIYSINLPLEQFHKEIMNGQEEMSLVPEPSQMILGYTQSQFQFLVAVYLNFSTLTKYSIANLSSKVYFVIVVLFILTETTLAVVINLKILYQIHCREAPQSVHMLQMMVYKAFCVSTITFILFFVFPGLVVCMGAIGLFHSHYPVNCMHFLIGLQAPSIILNIILTIKPYRSAAKRIMFRMTGQVSDHSTGFSAGLLTSVPFPNMTELMCLLVVILIFNLSLSLMMSFIKQYSLLQPFSAIGSLLKKNVLVLVLYALASILIDTVLGLFIYSNHLPQDVLENEIKNGSDETSGTPLSLAKGQFLLAVFQNFSTLTKYSMSKLQSKICFAIIIAFVFIETSLAIIINAKILYQIHYGEGLPSVHKLQVELQNKTNNYFHIFPKDTCAVFNQHAVFLNDREA
ncbi:serpentine type 7TM GPCR chemoreceptor srh domain-containing protein [Ditylenchus destructor]|uniref:Serpentine type 7TM GPCR chemoreceptor srh domain-containing protein n=1 Tax=Ditylenchus destructor TaxID=166010 RepID=A0AAD4R6Q9_9BILA|nr:serpentine type 7TM GPCR chemoreceptor srh domain-containing protein [Ditylenchus destructor]